MLDQDVIDMIEAFKVVDKNEDAIPVLGDEDAMRVLVGWSKTDQHWVRPRRKIEPMRPGNHAAAWLWIVAGWTTDVPSIAAAAGLSRRIAREKLGMLIRLRLVFPDGTMSKSAKTALNVHVANKLGIKQRPEPKSKKTDKPSGSENSN